MKKSNPIIACPAIVSADIAVFSSLFLLFSSSDGDLPSSFLPVWILCSALCFGLHLLLTGRGCDSSALICSSTVCFILQCVLIFALSGFFTGTMGVLYFIFAWAFTYYRISSVFIKGVSPEKLTDAFDGCAVLLVFTALVAAVKDEPSARLIPLAAALVLVLIAMISVRGYSLSGRISAGLRGSLFMVFAVAFAIAVAFSLIRFGGAGIKSAVGFLAEILSIVLRFIIRVVKAVVEFLASLTPEAAYEDLEMEAGLPSLSLEMPEDTGPSSAMLFYAFIAFIGAGFVGFIIYRIAHSVSLKRSRSSGLSAVSRRKGSVSLRISELKKAVKNKINYTLCRLLHRNTARGMLAELDAVWSRKGSGRKKNESCREFISRIKLDMPQCDAELDILAEAVDIELFGGRTVYTAAQAVELRKKLRCSEKGR